MASTGEEEHTGSASEAVVSCTSNSGLHPTRAALAVAMADELGRWDPNHDLMVNNGLVSLSWSAVCVKNNCANTKALLGQQDWAVNNWIDQTLFNATSYRQDLMASVDRQNNRIADLTRNHPDQLPPAHKLKMVAGPRDLGTGACGAHYVFQADHLDGTALSAAEAANLGNAICFYGNGDCGSNPYISFVVTGQNCPSGRTCVAVDPNSGDNTGSSTGGGSAPTYPLNRLYDPTCNASGCGSGSQLGKACTLANGTSGTMVNKCATNSSTCGYLYCVH